MPTHYAGTAVERRALNAYITLMRASDSVTARLQPRLDAARLTTCQFGVLEVLHHLGPQPQGRLGLKLLRSGGNITMVVDNLERRGLVRRERGREDRRTVTVRLRDAGRRLIARIFPRHVRAIVHEMDTLSARELETLRALCRKLGKGGTS
jgi:MarR family 2-MHQ and catechol resistance regulon transcriptional repressor